MLFLNLKSFCKLFLLAGLVINFTISVFANSIPKISQSFQDKIIKIELTQGGKIGFSAINTANNKSLEYHANTRFPMCSTYKFVLVAAILKKSMQEQGLLDKKIHYSSQDMVSSYSPYTQKHIADGMNVRELCYAAILSDNTAANLLIKELGGIDKLNQFAKLIGDKKFRLDRLEPNLNTAIPRDLKDTTSSNAMTLSIEKIVFDNILGEYQKNQFLQWIKKNNTGDNRIRAGVPKAWIVGDKTGTCSYGTTNDIGVIWPANCPPIVISVCKEPQYIRLN